MVAKASISRIVFPLIECKLNSALPCSFHSRASLVAKSLMSKEVDMTEDEKKEVLSSDEKGAAKSTLGGAVAGAVVGTVVGTPVVGTLIGAVSGAVVAWPFLSRDWFPHGTGEPWLSPVAGALHFLSHLSPRCCRALVA